MPGPASTFPVAVILNRFFTDDLVFILGISVSLLLAPIPSRKVPGVGRSRPGMPIRSPARELRGGLIAVGPGACKDAPETAPLRGLEPRSGSSGETGHAHTHRHRRH